MSETAIDVLQGWIQAVGDLSETLPPCPILDSYPGPSYPL